MTKIMDIIMISSYLKVVIWQFMSHDLIVEHLSTGSSQKQIFINLKLQKIDNKYTEYNS